MSDRIHGDTEFQILKWLPVKSLLRFRSVCKAWKERIDSQSFTLDHLAVQKPRLIVGFDEDGHFLALDPDKLPTVCVMIRPIRWRVDSDEIPPGNLKIHLANTLHGIVCFYTRIFAWFFLWNPYICKLASLPPPKFKSFNWDDYDIASYGSHGGFWIDPKTKEFKAVVFKLPYCGADVAHSQGAFYSSIQRDWKEISLEEIRGYYKNCVSPPVVIEQVAYWIAIHSNSTLDVQSVGVVFFDFVQERLGAIPALSKGWHVPVLCNWEGCGPSLVYRDRGRECDIYLREGDSWVKMFCIPLKSDISCIYWGTMIPLGEEKSITIRFLATTKSFKLVLFDTKNLSFSFSPVEFGLKEFDEYSTTFGLVESLLFPSV